MHIRSPSKISSSWLFPPPGPGQLCQVRLVRAAECPSCEAEPVLRDPVSWLSDVHHGAGRTCLQGDRQHYGHWTGALWQRSCKSQQESIWVWTQPMRDDVTLQRRLSEAEPIPRMIPVQSNTATARISIAHGKTRVAMMPTLSSLQWRRRVSVMTTSGELPVTRKLASWKLACNAW